MGDLRVTGNTGLISTRTRILGREDGGKCSGPASEVRVDVGIGSGAGSRLTSESADAARVVLRTICRPGPAFGIHLRPLFDSSEGLS